MFWLISGVLNYTSIFSPFSPPYFALSQQEILFELARKTKGSNSRTRALTRQSKSASIELRLRFVHKKKDIPTSHTNNEPPPTQNEWFSSPRAPPHHASDTSPHPLTHHRHHLSPLPVLNFYSFVVLTVIITILTIIIIIHSFDYDIAVEQQHEKCSLSSPAENRVESSFIGETTTTVVVVQSAGNWLHS